MRTISIRSIEVTRAVRSGRGAKSSARRWALPGVGIVALMLAAGCSSEVQSTPKANADTTGQKDGGAPGTGSGSSNNGSSPGNGTENNGTGPGGSNDGEDAAVPSDMGAASDAATSAESDAGGGQPTPGEAGATSAPGTCNTMTPHGCYTPQTGNNPMCPAQSPEQSASYPPAAEWKGCNGIQPAQPFALDPKATCTYTGPMNQVASCVCDTGLHWICVCNAGGAGTGTWPDCTP